MFVGETMALKELGEGFVEWVFDDREAPVNTLGAKALMEWERVLTILESNAWIKGLLLSSPKSSFIAGANIKEFPSIFSESVEAVYHWARKVQKLCNRVERLPFPTVAAIDGVALGGGFELALSVDRRILSHTALVGLPEVTLGICPGWGGSVRLSRLMGTTAAAPWMLDGQSRNSRDALDAGVADLVTQSNTLRATALNSLKALANQGELMWGKIRNKKRSESAETVTLPAEIKDYVSLPGRVPAYSLSKVIEAHQHLDFDEALILEAECFAMLAKGTDASVLIGMFIDEQVFNRGVKKLVSGNSEIKSLVMVGCGSIATEISYKSAANDIIVSVNNSSEGQSAELIAEVKAKFSFDIDKRRFTSESAQRKFSLLSSDSDEKSAEYADFLVESIVEDFFAKSDVLRRLDCVASDTAVILTTTSSISVEQLSDQLIHPGKLCGFHCFCPSSEVVEIVRGPFTSQFTISRAVQLAIRIGKKPIVVEESPGYVINRLLTVYFLAFETLLIKGASLTHIDEVMERFGWKVGPGRLADLLGVKSLAKLMGSVKAAFPERLSSVDAGIITRLAEVADSKGRGFYADERAEVISDAMSSLMGTPGSELLPDQDIINSLMLPLCSEALRCLDEGVVDSAHEIELAAVAGLGFPRFRGGPLQYIDSLGLIQFSELLSCFIGHSSLYRCPPGLPQRVESGKKSIKTVR